MPGGRPKGSIKAGNVHRSTAFRRRQRSARAINEVFYAASMPDRAVCRKKAVLVLAGAPSLQAEPKQSPAQLKQKQHARAEVLALARFLSGTSKRQWRVSRALTREQISLARTSNILEDRRRLLPVHPVGAGHYGRAFNIWQAWQFYRSCLRRAGLYTLSPHDSFSRYAIFIDGYKLWVGGARGLPRALVTHSVRNSKCPSEAVCIRSIDVKDPQQPAYNFCVANAFGDEKAPSFLASLLRLIFLPEFLEHLSNARETICGLMRNVLIHIVLDMAALALIFGGSTGARARCYCCGESCTLWDADPRKTFPFRRTLQQYGVSCCLKLPPALGASWDALLQYVYDPAHGISHVYKDIAEAYRRWLLEKGKSPEDWLSYLRTAFGPNWKFGHQVFSKLLKNLWHLADSFHFEQVTLQVALQTDTGTVAPVVIGDAWHWVHTTVKHMHSMLLVPDDALGGAPEYSWQCSNLRVVIHALAGTGVFKVSSHVHLAHFAQQWAVFGRGFAAKIIGEGQEASHQNRIAQYKHSTGSTCVSSRGGFCGLDDILTWSTVFWSFVRDGVVSVAGRYSYLHRLLLQAGRHPFIPSPRLVFFLPLGIEQDINLKCIQNCCVPGLASGQLRGQSSRSQ